MKVKASLDMLRAVDYCCCCLSIVKATVIKVRNQIQVPKKMLMVLG